MLPFQKLILLRPTKDNSQPRNPNLSDANRAQPESLSIQGRRAFGPSGRLPLTRSTTSGMDALEISSPRSSDNVDMRDLSENDDLPRKRVAIGDGSYGSPLSDLFASPPPLRSRARSFESHSDLENVPRNMMNSPGRPQTGKRQLWVEEQAPLTKASFNDLSNVASITAQKSRAQKDHAKARKPPFQPTPPFLESPRRVSQQSAAPLSFETPKAHPSIPENFDLVLQPETRPISQEQLVAEVKGIYAGLVMVEAKCIEVDNKQATLAQADSSEQPKLNNEQWQALIALHRTLLHEHHDFFLASQHPSASPALRRLAAKYAMPARMWRHGIHSFLELLKHRLPTSLDHMLAFIYLAYSMMALLYETVPAFEGTWIECLGDLGRYRMAIEDDDIRDREVWTGVARHWYSKASDKAPTTGRLYHHLAILARPNALQQLFYYAESLYVLTPFISALESILTLFYPVLNAENHQGQDRLPPLHTSCVKAHDLLFTNKDMERYGSTLSEFLNLLDNQIGRVTRKFMEQGYHIAIANSVAILGFASKDNVLMKAMAGVDADKDLQMAMGPIPAGLHSSMRSFRSAHELSNSSLEIILQRIGDPNVLPFMHVTLVFTYYMARHPGVMGHLQGVFPCKCLSTMLNTLLPSYETANRAEKKSFPRPDKVMARPFPEDFALRGLLWTEDYFPGECFTNGKMDTLLHAQSEPSPQVLDFEPCCDKIQSQTLPHQDSGSRLINLKRFASRHLNLGTLCSILRRLRDHGSLVGISIFYGQIRTVGASGTVTMENKPGNMFQFTLESAAPAAKLAVTLTASVGGANFIQRRWGGDVWLYLDLFLHFVLLILAHVSRFSNEELMVLCCYCAGTNFHWMRKKLTKLSRTGGVTALVLNALSFYTGWKVAPHIPGLEARFENYLIPKLIASLPAFAGYSAAWVATFEQTGLAQAIEDGVYNSQIQEFTAAFLRAFLLRSFERAIGVLMECLFPHGDTGLENNPVRRPAQDIEADPRAYYPGNDPFRGPGNENFPRESEDGISDHWTPPGQY